MKLSLPRALVIDELAHDNPIRQIGEFARVVPGYLGTYQSDGARGLLFQADDTGAELFVGRHSTVAPEKFAHAVSVRALPSPLTADIQECLWTRHPLATADARDTSKREAHLRSVSESWRDAFRFVAEDPARGVVGLRPPQLGAVYAAAAHWMSSDEPGTIVLPTGTGKTDTMIALLVSMRCERVLVVVPSDALRDQLTEKFLTLGVLRAPGATLLADTASFPVVASLRHVPKTADEVDTVFGRAQVVVTTSAIAGQSTPEVAARMAEVCSHLFIDEAHHSEAPTWRRFRSKFATRRTLQFTATPFREDGLPLEGKIVFKYPLARAQAEGYFKPIRFTEVFEFDSAQADRAIATAALAQLKADDKHRHILMARVDSVARAAEVFAYYKDAVEYKPVELHSGVKAKRAREQARRQLISGESRIVVCVDMLGEGFDLPELKIAAFHDIRKSLSVTLQLAGRFTRARADLGVATFIANTASVDVRHELRNLYSREPDWNVLLPELSERMIGDQQSLQDFLAGFGTSFASEIPLRLVQPAASTVVYRSQEPAWEPTNFEAGIPKLGKGDQIHSTINHATNMLVVVVARRVAVPWTDARTLFTWEWELYVAYWIPTSKLLFINGSTLSGDYRALARAIGGDTATLIRGDTVFRTFAGVNRLRLQNVGLSEQIGRNVRYTGRMGPDVEPALDELVKGKSQKSVLAGTGFEYGEPIAVGASRKGRIWSHQRLRLDEFADWCTAIGGKLLDEAIDPATVLAGTLEGQHVSARPQVFAIGVDWPAIVFEEAEASWIISIDGKDCALAETTLRLPAEAEGAPLMIEVSTDNASVRYELEFIGTEEAPEFRFRPLGNVPASIRRRLRGDAHDLQEFFHAAPPTIWFANGAMLEGDHFVSLRVRGEPYNRDSIQVWDWANTDIQVESQGLDRIAHSIQRRVIQEAIKQSNEIVFDDDGNGEAADVVAVHLVGSLKKPERLEVTFFHCKFSKDAKPGARIDDLYAVCGQAQCSVRWLASPTRGVDLFSHLLHREQLRAKAGKATRFDKGGSALTQQYREIAHLCPIQIEVVVVQPGMSRAKLESTHLELLGVTRTYLWETYQLRFSAIGSA